MSKSGVRKCSSCGLELQFAQKIPFRIKGTSGYWKLLVGEWAELGEEMLSLEVHVCPRCGEVRLLADEKSKESLLKLTPKAFLQICANCGRDIPIASEQCPHCGATQAQKKS